MALVKLYKSRNRQKHTCTRAGYHNSDQSSIRGIALFLAITAALLVALVAADGAAAAADGEVEAGGAAAAAYGEVAADRAAAAADGEEAADGALCCCGR